MHYCLRISDKEFEKQRSTESKEALNELLDQIINSTTMSSKEKSKRTKLVSYHLNYFSRGCHTCNCYLYPSIRQYSKISLPIIKVMIFLFNL